ncbi:MAG: hypothetical protein ACI93T_000049 [Porticoccaceae bacterium]
MFVRFVPACLGKNRAVSDEEDIVLSVLNSFYDPADDGRFPNLTDAALASRDQFGSPFGNGTSPDGSQVAFLQQWPEILDTFE